MTIKNNLIPLISSTVLFSLLTACGGGGSNPEPSKTPAANNQQPHQQPQQQPHKLADKHMRKMHKLSRDTNSALTVSSNDNSITITYTADDLSSEKNFQFFIHADNDTSAGIQLPFAWDKLGAEYMIENGTLYKSKTNDTVWDWRAISSDLSYSVTDTSISLTIDKSLLDNLAAKIFVGFMERDSAWQVDSFYPESGTIAAFNIGNGSNDTSFRLTLG